jgi:hypothetical protein
LVIDFAPHELEYLRESHAHRRLGFSRDQMKQWIAAAGMRLEAAEDLAPEDESSGLTVTVWSALDRRAAGSGQKQAEEQL